MGARRREYWRMTITRNELLTKQEAARELRVCVRSLENMMQARRFAFIRLGRCVRIERAELDRLKQSFTVEAVR
jgi:excisionase family DNA binding protein